MRYLCPVTCPPPSSYIYIGDFDSHHTDWGYSSEDANGARLTEWASLSNITLVHDSNQRGTFTSARWQRDFMPDLCWVSAINSGPLPALPSVLDDFPRSQHRPTIVHIGLTISTTGKRRWNFRKADWSEFLDLAEKTIPLISRNSISVEDAYRRFSCALSKAARASIPR